MPATPQAENSSGTNVSWRIYSILSPHAPDYSSVLDLIAQAEPRDLILTDSNKAKENNADYLAIVATCHNHDVVKAFFAKAPLEYVQGDDSYKQLMNAIIWPCIDDFGGNTKTYTDSFPPAIFHNADGSKNFFQQLFSHPERPLGAYSEFYATNIQAVVDAIPEADFAKEIRHHDSRTSLEVLGKLVYDHRMQQARPAYDALLDKLSMDTLRAQGERLAFDQPKLAYKMQILGDVIGKRQSGQLDGVPQAPGEMRSTLEKPEPQHSHEQP